MKKESSTNLQKYSGQNSPYTSSFEIPEMREITDFIDKFKKA